MNPALTATRTDWVSVAKSVSERAGRTYSANYCREVAINFRSSSVIKPILRELGVITEDTKEETLDSEQQSGDALEVEGRMSDIMTTPKPSWIKVAKDISAKFGKSYDPVYVQKVAAGKKTNHQITPYLRELGVMYDQVIVTEDGVQPNPGATPFSQVVIPPEAAPYCDAAGIINWAKVQEKIRQECGEGCDVESGYRLSMILNGATEDKYMALPIMRALKLDEIISARRINGSHWHVRQSQMLAEKYAKDFNLDISKVPGTGPNGEVLKRDIVAYHRFLKAGKAPPAVPSSPTAPADDTDSDDLLTEQSELIKSQRLALDAAFEVTAEYRAQIDALQARVSQLESREVQVTTQPRQIHITLNLDGALA